MIAVELQRADATVVARPDSDIDAANAREANDRLGAALEEDASRLVVDLSEVAYIDSAGIDMLLRLHERLRQRRAELRLVIPAGSHLHRVSEIVDLPGTVPVHDSVAQALAAEPAGANPPGASAHRRDRAPCEPPRG